MDLSISIALSFAAFCYLGWVLFRCQSGLLGFTVYNAFLVGSASLSGLLFAVLTGGPTAWVTDAHLQVFNYSAIGLALMGTGIWFGWRPMVRRDEETRTIVSRPLWVNPTFVYLCLLIGFCGGLLDARLRGVPTFSSVANSLTAFLYIGLLVAVWLALVQRSFLPLLISGTIVAANGIASVIASGFIGILVPAAFQSAIIIAMRRRVTIVRLAMVALVLGSMVYPYAAWLEVRDIVRGGGLEGVGLIKATGRLGDHFVVAMNPSALDARDLLDLILWRLDHSSILAAQVLYQPEREPFAYGATITDSLLIALVPRFIWPEKPLVAGGSGFVSKYTGLAWKETSVGLPYQFELYANGGRWAVFIGLFLVGWLTARLELTLFLRRLELRKLLPLFVVVTVLCNGGQRMYLSLMSLATGVVGAYLAGFMLEVQFPEFAKRAIGQVETGVRAEPNWPELATESKA